MFSCKELILSDNESTALPAPWNVPWQQSASRLTRLYFSEYTTVGCRIFDKSFLEILLNKPINFRKEYSIKY